MNKKFPYRKSFFDALISTQVIHHNRPGDIKFVVKEIGRVLRRNGVIFITVPAGKTQATSFRKIDERTFVPLDGMEKGIIHFYFNKRLIRQFFRSFSIQDIHVDKWNHYCFFGVRET